MKAILAILGAIALTAVAAYLQPGQLYAPIKSASLIDAAGRLESLPERFGKWESVGQGLELSEAVQQELGLYGYLSRRYRNVETGEEVGLLLMLGVPGPLVRHPPDICYANRGSRQLSADEIKIEVDGEKNRFRVLVHKNEVASSADASFVVAYAHTTDGEWDVPRFPRMEYGGEPMLYKMQALVTGSQPVEGMAAICEHFLGDFVQAFPAVLYD